MEMDPESVLKNIPLSNNSIQRSIDEIQKIFTKKKF